MGQTYTELRKEHVIARNLDTPKAIADLEHDARHLQRPHLWCACHLMR